ncbi:MAG TPA: hypothetical protein PLJ22_03055, partial [Kiritimatiellia bacterium]|nr:hypothetical protein [Kiritimatiellia bacterium]
MNSEWNIRACADQCMRCQRKFADKENLMSRLCFAPEGYLREDFCGGCWPERATPTAAAEVSAWAAVWHAPAPKAPEPLKKETAESLLRELMETDDPAKRAEVEVVIQWNTSYSEHVMSFANNIYTPDGGMHMEGFRTALTRVVNDYARKQGI